MCHSPSSPFSIHFIYRKPNLLHTCINIFNAAKMYQCIKEKYCKDFVIQLFVARMLRNYPVPQPIRKFAYSSFCGKEGAHPSLYMKYSKLYQIQTREQKLLTLACTRDVVLTNKLWERTRKIAILKQLRTHFEAKCEKCVDTPFPRVPAPEHPCLYTRKVFLFTNAKLMESVHKSGALSSCLGPCYKVNTT